MSRPTDTITEQLSRIPGLFRKRELPDLFETQRHYQIEEAGEHADGTPLFALFVSSHTDDEQEIMIDGNAANSGTPGNGLRGIRLSVLLDGLERRT